MITTIIKQPAEVLRPAVSFATAAPIAAVLAVAVAARGLVAGALPLLAQATITAGIVTASVSGGSDGERYSLTIRARDTDGAELESEIEIVMIESVWQMPDGGAAWLSVADFVKRFGLGEVVSMTDAAGDGRIDRDYLISALTDAQAEAEAHLAGRYALPLATVPRIVAMAIGDRARARLYPRGAPDGVAEMAKNALRTFERIQAGQLSLGLSVAQEPPSPPGDAAIGVIPGRRQYPDGLAEY